MTAASRHVERKLTRVEGLPQLEDLLVQLDVLHTGGAPLLLQGFQLIHQLGAAVLHCLHVSHEDALVCLQLGHLLQIGFTVGPVLST